MSSNPAQASCTRYNMWKFVSDLCQSVVYFGYPGFLHQENWSPWYNLNWLKVALNPKIVALTPFSFRHCFSPFINGFRLHYSFWNFQAFFSQNQTEKAESTRNYKLGIIYSMIKEIMCNVYTTVSVWDCFTV